LKIFYSWQSDLDSKFNRNFIKDCLEKAIKLLHQEFDIKDAIRIDHDTKGVGGTPDITNTILEKIEGSDLFIGDLTFIIKTQNNRFCPNPNVLIELGYALKCLGDGRLINVMNTAYGKPDNNLPFDLAHKRWPIQYELNEENLNKKTEVVKALVASFKAALFPFISKPKKSEPAFQSNVEIIHHREKLRKESEIFFAKLPNDYLPSVIIRDIDRIDDYPNVEDENEGEGISSWFKLALLETYARGIKVVLRISELTLCENGLRHTKYNEGEKGDVKAFLIGEIPYDSIVTVNWDGDDYYSSPHIYCHFNQNGEPYEKLVFCEKTDMGNGHYYYKEISDYETVKTNSAD
jgi:hypothetical protein